MKKDTFVKLQKKFGGRWIATSKSGAKVFAAGKNLKELFKLLKERNIPPNKTVIGRMRKYGKIYIYSSLSQQDH